MGTYIKECKSLTCLFNTKLSKSQKNTRGCPSHQLFSYGSPIRTHVKWFKIIQKCWFLDQVALLYERLDTSMDRCVHSTCSRLGPHRSLMYYNQRKTVTYRKINAVRFGGFDISSFRNRIRFTFRVRTRVAFGRFVRLDFETLGRWHRANLLAVGTWKKVRGFWKKSDYNQWDRGSRSQTRVNTPRARKGVKTLT